MRVPAAVVAGVVGLCLCLGAAAPAQTPEPISDAEFWRLTTELSEPGGRFAQQLMSNEDSQAFVIPGLLQRVRPGGAYLGVGEELNFTYVAAVQP